MDYEGGLAASIEGAVAAYYLDEESSGAAFAVDEGLIEALGKTYVASYAKNIGGSLDKVREELAAACGHEPTTDEICDAAIALSKKQAEMDAGLLSRMFVDRAACLAEEYAPALARTFDVERSQAAQNTLSGRNTGEAPHRGILGRK